MAAYRWYKTHVTQGVSDQPSELVDVWFGTTAPADPSLYDIVIIDANGSGAIDPDEWLAATGNSGSKARGGRDPNDMKLLDPDPAGGPTDGWLYTNSPIPIGTPDLAGDLIINFPPIDPNGLNVPCFVQGTLINTVSGARKIEDLRPGDLICTVDHGYQPLKAVWADDVPGDGIRAPVVFEANFIGNKRSLLVSQNHRMLVRGAAIQLLFGLEEALVMAKSLCDGTRIRRVEVEQVSYFHLLFDRHELVYAEGVVSESLMPSYYQGLQHAYDMFDDSDRTRDAGEACRACVKHQFARHLPDVSKLWGGVTEAIATLAA